MRLFPLIKGSLLVMRFSVLRQVGRALFALVTIGALSASLTACTSTVSLQSAPAANDPGCAAITVRLPDDIDGNAQRPTDAQATSAWGSPTRIILRCGLPEVKASTLICTTIGGVDWLVDPSEEPSYRFITFGRNPATEVIVDYKHASGVSTIEALSQAVAAGPKADVRCLNPKN
jgi:hypothetical protein